MPDLKGGIDPRVGGPTTRTLNIRRLRGRFLRTRVIGRDDKHDSGKVQMNVSKGRSLSEREVMSYLHISQQTHAFQNLHRRQEEGCGQVLVARGPNGAGELLTDEESRRLPLDDSPALSLPR